MKKLLFLSIGMFLLLTQPTAKAEWVTVPGGHIFYGVTYGYPHAWGYWGYPNYYGFYGYSYYSPVWYPTYIPTYGAIAYSKQNDQVGYSWGQSSRAAASASAVQGCGSEDCRPVVWVQGGCAVVTTSKSTNRLGWAYAREGNTAQLLAKRSCSAEGATDCEQRAWVCSF